MDIHWYIYIHVLISTVVVSQFGPRITESYYVIQTDAQLNNMALKKG
jgi:hypothetical protein